MSESTTAPISTATNSYELLDDVCRVITEEPKRLHMNYICVRGAQLERMFDERNSEDNEVNEGIAAIPACGTVGCIAGWSLVLTGRTAENTEIFDTDGAAVLLGLDWHQQTELFFPADLVADSSPQTDNHAARTVKHIHDFQARNAAQLLAHRIIAHV